MDFRFNQAACSLKQLTIFLFWLFTLKKCKNYLVAFLGFEMLAILTNSINLNPETKKFDGTL